MPCLAKALKAVISILGWKISRRKSSWLVIVLLIRAAQASLTRSDPFTALFKRTCERRKLIRPRSKRRTPNPRNSTLLTFRICASAAHDVAEVIELWGSWGLAK